MALVSLGALAVGVLAPLLAPSAGAVVTNPGDLKVSMRLSVVMPTFSVAGASTVGSGDATLRKNGLINIPQSSLTFASTGVHISVPSPPPGPGATDTIPPISSSSTVKVQFVATSDFYGGVDPTNGSGFMVGSVEVLWTQPGTLADCTVGPFRIVARTNTQGGTPYSPTAGTVSMVDPGFTIDAIPVGAPGCGGYESGINAALSLPVTTTTTTTAAPGVPTTPPTTYPPNSGPPVPSVVMALTFTPPPRSVPVQHPVPPPPPVARTTIDTPTTAAFAPPVDGTPGGGSNPARHHRRHHPRKTHNPPHKRRHPHRPRKKPAKRPLAHRTRPRRTRAHPIRRRGTPPPGRWPRHLPRSPGAGQLSYVTAAFVRPSPSALTTGLDMVGLLGLLVFSSLALWLVTSEVSALSANARRLRTHRIAGVTRRR